MSDYISEKIEQYERKLKQAEKAGKHNKAKKYQEKLERLRADVVRAGRCRLRQVRKATGFCAGRDRVRRPRL